MFTDIVGIHTNSLESVNPQDNYNSTGGLTE